MKRVSEVEVAGRQLRLSNLEKVFYPEVGFTKGQVLDYYRRIAPVLLPHILDRPLTLKRYPDGVSGKHFYEKQCPEARPEWVKLAPIWSDVKGRNIDYCVVRDLPSLLWAVNLGVIEMHVSLSRRSNVKEPTVIAFDLDPGPPANVLTCARVALWLRELFEKLGMESFSKVSGSLGMQVYVPLNTQATYAQTKSLAHAVAELLEKQHPELVVSRMAKVLRRGKVFIDWSQNDERKSTVSVYSLRAKSAQPFVSTPLKWSELESALRHEDAALLRFDPEQALKRVRKLGDLFAGVLKLKQPLPRLT